MNKNILFKSVKIFVYALIFTLCFAVVSFADERPEFDTDNAITLLKQLDILEDNFSINGNVKRDEFVGYAVKLVGLSGYTTEKDLPFEDVAINDANYAAIVAAYDAGIIQGNSSKTFAPFDDITLAQASKILTGITGYSPIAEATGGYFAGYLTAAKKAGLLDNVDTSEEVVSKKTLVALLYNALTVDVYEQVSFGSDTATYGLVEGKNLLLQTFKIKYGEGVVTADRYTSLTGNGTDDDTLIIIDENSLFRVKDGADGLLGYDTFYFYEDESGTPDIICIFKKSVNATVAVKNESFLKFEKEVFYYEDEKGNEKKKKTDLMFDVIYNGAADIAWDYTDFDVKNGSFELLDNDGDGDIDVLFVKSYTDYVVRGVSASAETISLDFGKGSIVMDDDSYINKFTDKGKETDYTSLVKGDIISVGESKVNGGIRVRVFEVSHTGFSGTVSAIGDDKVIVNQKEYGYINYPGQLDMYMGLSGMFFVNADGKIVACDPGDRYFYGYVRGAKSMGNLDAKLTVKLLCTAGSGAEYALSENVKVDGRSSLSDDDILSRIKADEVVRYRLNNNGEIISIDTLSTGAGNADDELTLEKEYLSIRYKTNARLFTEIDRLVDNETVIFIVPQSGNDKEYEVVNLSYLVNDERYNISLYDVSEMLVAGAVVVEADAEMKKPSNTETLCIITGIGEKLTADGESVISFNVNKSGLTIKEYWADPEDTDVYSNLKKGDIVQFKVSTTESGRVLAARILHSSASETPYKHETISTNENSLNVSWGEVKAVDDTTLLLNVNSENPDDVRPYYLKSGLAFYIYDVKDESVTMGTVADISTGDKVFLRESYFAVQEGVIIR